ncbi:hypothetical protein KY290_035071 [Solanum tuberosum]|uniref:Retrotransposon gag domain-containing protein n=1 Tax=Solanum tuberosum TaxID=4113 RepID=A0ABQ7U6A9_SOLTU|nr:hypothetical protein KY290_035071 [Solanum tuberosum]
MPRTKAYVSSDRGEAVPKKVAKTLDRGRGRAIGHGHRLAPTRGHAHVATPARGRVIEFSPEPQVEVVKDQVLPEFTAPLFQYTLLWMQGVFENFFKGGVTGTLQPLVVPAPGACAHIAPEGGKIKDVHEFLTLCHGMLEVVGIFDARGVFFIALQLYGPARECWRTYVRSEPVRYPPVEWDTFSSAFKDCFIPWSVREKSRLRFGDIRHGGLSVTEYEARFYEISKHSMTIVLYEAERVHKFARGLTFSTRSYVFRAAIERDSFQSIVSTTKEATLIVIEEFRVLRGAALLVKFLVPIFRGRGSHIGNSFFQHRGIIHASMPVVDSVQTSRGSYGSGRGGYSSSSSLSQKLYVLRSCYGCG